MLRLLHLKILILVWIGVITSSFFIPEYLLTRYWFDTRVITWPTFAWISLCILSVWAGSFIERSLYSGKNRTALNLSNLNAVSYEKLCKMLWTFRALLFIVTAVILFRFAWCVQMMGSLKETVIYALTDPGHFKFSPWQDASFHGLGAVSDLIVACTIFAFAIFALLKKYREEIKDYYSFGYDENNIEILYKSARKFLILSMLVIVLYFLLSNERIAFVGGFLGGVVAYFLIVRRFPFRNFLYLIFFLLLLWIFVEAGRRQFIGNETWALILEHAKNQLLLYLVAGLRNVDTVLNYLPNNTYGWYTLNFILIPLKLDFLASISDSFYGFTSYQVRPGFGVIPIFGVAFADFHIAALGYFAILGFIYQRVHRKAVLEKNFLAIQIYAFALVALIISFVVFLPTIARFWVNIVALVFINKTICFAKT